VKQATVFEETQTRICGNRPTRRSGAAYTDLLTWHAGTGRKAHHSPAANRGDEPEDLVDERAWLESQIRGPGLERGPKGRR
jgi:hypothetical protein